MLNTLLCKDHEEIAASPEEYCLPRHNNEKAELRIVKRHTPFDLNVNKKFTRKTARSALDVFLSMEKERDIAKIASSSRNTNALAIGMMLHNAYRKNLIDTSIPPSKVMADICKKDICEGHNTVFNRYRAIQHLKELGFISGPQIDRQIRPSGTTPSIRIVGSLITHASGGKFGLEDICSSSRGKQIVYYRFQAIWILRTVCGHSLTAIGSYMGNRDHTTILNSINKVNVQYLKDEGGFASEIAGMCERADMMGVIQGRNILIRSIRRNMI